MEIKDNISLKAYNTFGIDVNAKHFVEVTGLVQLEKLLRLSAYPKRFIISGGSNMLLTNDIDALVMHINLKGIRIVEEDDGHVVLKVMAGENWHELVLWSLRHSFGGLENLSLIPGNTGTAPIQNIGAYGVELKDIFVECEAMNIETLELEAFSKKACEFGYRDSIFKRRAKGKYIITAVVLRLTKKNHVLHTLYGAIEEELKMMAVVKPTIHDISKAVVSIRSKKLPNPSELGNSGSFFKNPVLSKRTFEKFHKNYPNAPFYALEGNEYKIPAGWLIEQSGFKGKRFGDAGVHEQQALVLVNHGNASGQDILALAEKIQTTVFDTYGIRLTPEVNIIR